MKNKIKLPRYAWIGGLNQCAMRLVDPNKSNENLMLQAKELYYWRDAGAWGTEVMEKDGKLITSGHHAEFSYLNNKEVIPCTKAEWKKDNQGYV